jgi:hypothetical protein
MRSLLIRVAGVTAMIVAAVATPAIASAEPGAAPLQSETFTIGPFDLAPQGEIGDQVNRLFEDAPRPDGEIAVRSIEFALVDGTGADVPAHMAHLHHIVLLDSTRPDQLCSFPDASRFAGTGKELQPFGLPDGYAYHSGDGPWSSVYHVMNLSPAPVEVAVQYTVTWQDAAETDLLDVEPYFLDVTGCWGTSEYQVPGDGGPDSVHEQARTYEIERDGIAVVGGGHVHDGGIDLRLTEGDTEICRSEAVYGEGGHGGHHSLVAVTPCGQIDYEWSQGDEITLTSRYQNHAPTAGAMGIMVMYVHHTGPPPPPPTMEILGVGVYGANLLGSMQCNRDIAVSLDGSITQTKNGPPITASGYSTDLTTCGTTPTWFVIPLMYGNGALTGGEASYQVYAWGSTGRDYVQAELAGEVQIHGRIELPGVEAEPFGPLDIVIDSTPSVHGNFVTGTVSCPEPMMLSLNVDANQWMGRHLINGYGYDNLVCDGTTAFAIPIRANGRMTGGPVDVVVQAYSYDPDDYDYFSVTVQVATVRFTGPANLDESSYEIPDPDPTSPLSVTGVEQVDDELLVTVEYAGCPGGADYNLNVWIVEDRNGRGHRLPPATANGFGYGQCDGSSTFTVPAMDIGTNRLGVWAFMWWYDGESSEFASNTLRVRVG